MQISTHGTIRGKTIELDDELGLPDGSNVKITVVVSRPKDAWGEGIKRSAGVAADVPEFDQVFEQIANDRKMAKYRESES